MYILVERRSWLLAWCPNGPLVPIFFAVAGAPRSPFLPVKSLWNNAHILQTDLKNMDCV